MPELPKSLRETRVAPARAVVFKVTHMKKDDTAVNAETQEKIDKMKELMPQDTTTTLVSTHGSIRWSEDDVCARAMERPEYFNSAVSEEQDLGLYQSDPTVAPLGHRHHPHRILYYYCKLVY